MANDDSTKVIISIETVLKNLDRTLKGLSAIEKQLRALSGIKGGIANFDKAAIQAQRLQNQQQKLILQSRELANREERAAQTAQRLAQSRDRLAQASQRQVTAEQRAAREVARIQAQTARQAQAQERIREQAAKVLANVQIREARRAADVVANTLNRNADIAKRVQGQLNSLGAAALRVGGGLRSFGATAAITLTAPLTALATIATRNAVEFDSLQRGLQVMAGSAEKAAEQLARLREIAKAPGIGFQEAIQGSIRLQAVGFAAEDAEEALRQFANAVALTGGGRSELERITVQLGQLAAKGKVVAQDLKPIIEAGPAVGQALLKAFGTVNSEDIQALGLSTEEFFDRLLAGLRDLPRAAAGARTAFENFQDSIFLASLALGNALLPALQKLVDAALPIIEKLADTFKSLPEPVQLTIIAIGAFAAALGPVLFLVGGIASGIGAITTAVAAIIPLLGTIGLPAILVALGGIALVIGELTVIVTALAVAWRTNFLGIQQTVNTAVTAILRTLGEIREVFEDFTARVLPTLRSLIIKFVAITTALWEKYGKDVVAAIGGAFRVASDAFIGFLRVLTDFVDLVLKLIDGDWKGAWNAFARILVNGVKAAAATLLTAQALVVAAMAVIGKKILQALEGLVRSSVEASQRFIASMAAELINGAPTITGALTQMLADAASAVNVTAIAAVLIGRLIGALQRAASEGEAGFARITEGPGFARFSPEKRKPRAGGVTGSGGGGRGGADDALRELRQREAALNEAQDRANESRRNRQLATLKATIEQQFDLTKDGLQRELQVLDQNFEDRKTTIRAFFTERLQLQQEEINAEIAREVALSQALKDELKARQATIRAEFERTRAEITKDPKLTGRARDLALQTAELEKQTKLDDALNEFQNSQADNIVRIQILRKQLGDIIRQNVVDEKSLTDEILKQQEAIKADLLEQQGLTVEAAGQRLRVQFRDTLRDLRVDVSGLSGELQDALNRVDLAQLQAELDKLPEPVQQMVALFDIAIKRAEILEKERLVDTFSVRLRTEEERIQQKVLDGVISEREGRAEILAVQQKYRAVLLDILEGERQRAKALGAGGEDELARIEAQIQAVEQLGKVIDDVGKQINEDIFGAIESGFEGIFNSLLDGVESVKQAFIDLGRSIFQVINRQIAQSLTESLFGELLKPGATNTQGTFGGLLSRLLGLGPKQPAGQVGGKAVELGTEAAGKTTETAGITAAATALSTAGTTTAAALTTGGTSAAAAMTTGGASFATSVFAAGAGFATAVATAGAAFVAAITAASAVKAAGDIGSSLAGAAGAATGMYPATPGGIVRIVEGGYPEAVLTTDPRHATQQVRILQRYLKETKGLFGRIPGFAQGGFDIARDAEAEMLQSLSNSRSGIPAPSPSLQPAVSGGDTNLRILNLWDRKQIAGGYIRSSEGARDIMNVLSENASEVSRRISIK